ncbi:MAG TPA: methyltransferase domain-containing protein [Methanomicrobiales archaeon]|jgi:tRNA (guanine10-N2)-dimethyltransferase|nr:methyltransferase domain-containing protein [Methanomicrobiales archaeon]
MRLIFELSGEHPTLPAAELECVGKVLEARPQVAVAECPAPAAAARLALTHVVLEYLGCTGASAQELSSLLGDLALSSDLPYAARVKKVAGSAVRDPVPALERLMGTLIDGPVSLDRPEAEFRAILSGDRIYLGRVLLRIDRGRYDLRRPSTRPFFHPGVMLPLTARAVVNLSLVCPGETLNDPFCGTGGILGEAGLVGASPVGSDADPAMAAGCRLNFPGIPLLLADASALPLRSCSVDAVVTDLPYGQSSWIRNRSLDALYPRALGEIHRVLRPGRRAVVVAHREIAEIASASFTVLQVHRQRIHKSLTRRITVLLKE